MQHINVDAPKSGASGISEKGLSAGSLHLVDAIVIGISCIAPAYTLTSALGPTIAAVGRQLPAIFIIGFLPMLLTAFGYRELNKSMPDAGTSFTWGVRAFGPRVGWMAGWGLVIATVVVLSNLAGIAVDFFYLTLSQIFSNPHIAELSTQVWINITTCLAFIIGATWISYHGIHMTQKFQYVLVTYQVLIMLGFGVTLFYQAYTGKAFDFTPVKLSWFNPANIHDFGTFTAGICLSLFIFWGWDVTLTMSEETKGSKSIPGKAATMTVVLIVLIYLFVAVGAMVYAGVGAGALGLGNPAIQENVFFALAGPVMGPAAIFMSLAVLGSSAASLQSTFVSPTRTLLAMAHYGALPSKFATVHPRYFTPGFAIIVSAVTAGVFYAIMRFLSEAVLWDTISTLGMMICFYYGLTALSCVWLFRTQWFTSAHNFFYKFLFPLAGGLVLAVLFFSTLINSMDPSFGSGSQIGGIGLVFILAVVLILVGVFLMLVCSVKYPDFFEEHTGLQKGPL